MQQYHFHYMVLQNHLVNVFVIQILVDKYHLVYSIFVNFHLNVVIQRMLLQMVVNMAVHHSYRHRHLKVLHLHLVLQLYQQLVDVDDLTSARLIRRRRQPSSSR